MKFATHNSGTGEKLVWWQWAFGAVLNATSRCQDMTIKEQLDFGVKYFNLQITQYKGEWVFSHGLCVYNYKLSDALNLMQQYSTEESPIYYQLYLDKNFFLGQKVEEFKNLVVALIDKSKEGNVKIHCAWIEGTNEYPYKSGIKLDCYESYWTQSWADKNAKSWIDKLPLPKRWSKLHNQEAYNVGRTHNFFMGDFVNHYIEYKEDTPTQRPTLPKPTQKPTVTPTHTTTGTTTVYPTPTVTPTDTTTYIPKTSVPPFKVYTDDRTPLKTSNKMFVILDENNKEVRSISNIPSVGVTVSISHDSKKFKMYSPFVKWKYSTWGTDIELPVIDVNEVVEFTTDVLYLLKVFLITNNTTTSYPTVTPTRKVTTTPTHTTTGITTVYPTPTRKVTTTPTHTTTSYPTVTPTRKVTTTPTHTTTSYPTPTSTIGTDNLVLKYNGEEHIFTDGFNFVVNIVKSINSVAVIEFDTLGNSVAPNKMIALSDDTAIVRPSLSTFYRYIELMAFNPGTTKVRISATWADKVINGYIVVNVNDYITSTPTVSSTVTPTPSSFSYSFEVFTKGKLTHNAVLPIYVNAEIVGDKFTYLNLNTTSKYAYISSMGINVYGKTKLNNEIVGYIHSNGKATSNYRITINANLSTEHNGAINDTFKPIIYGLLPTTTVSPTTYYLTTVSPTPTVTSTTT